MDRGISGRARPWAPWANISSDFLGSVLRLLPYLADRASLRSVCRAWREAARLDHPPPPLPLLMLSKFSYSSFTLSKETTGVRCIPLPEAVAADDVRCVGSFEGWLVGAQPSRQRRNADGECFLLNAFSQDVVRLPRPCAFHFFDYFSKSIPILNTSASVVNCTIHEREYRMSFSKVVLSASPDSGPKCIVAAIAAFKLAIWRPEMMSWCVCTFKHIGVTFDIAFYQGKLYLVFNFTADLISFELEEGDRGMMVSCAEKCVIEPLPPVEDSCVKTCNIVEWRGKLLLVIRYANGYCRSWQKIIKVGVFALDFGTNPHKVTEIDSLDGDCLFISSCSSKSFPASQYDGYEGDLVYFVNKDLQPTSICPSFDVFVYNVRDATMATSCVVVPEDNFEASERSLAWFFPPE